MVMQCRVVRYEGNSVFALDNVRLFIYEYRSAGTAGGYIIRFG